MRSIWVGAPVAGLLAFAIAALSDSMAIGLLAAVPIGVAIGWLCAEIDLGRGVH